MIFLGIDCGTQSTKTIALDWESGEILASSQKAYGFVPGLPPGAMEQNPKDWIDAAEQSIGQVIGKLGARKAEVHGIGVSGQQHGLVVLDQQDQVVRPAKLWNDTTTSAQCDEVTEHFGGPASVIALVGNTMRTGYTAPKIMWLRQNEPENWKKTRPAPSRLPELLAHWRKEDGIRRCFRHRIARCQRASMVNEGR
jgi:xylulokinase